MRQEMKDETGDKSDMTSFPSLHTALCCALVVSCVCSCRAMCVLFSCCLVRAATLAPCSRDRPVRHVTSEMSNGSLSGSQPGTPALGQCVSVHVSVFVPVSACASAPASVPVCLCLCLYVRLRPRLCLYACAAAPHATVLDSAFACRPSPPLSLSPDACVPASPWLTRCPSRRRGLSNLDLKTSNLRTSELCCTVLPRLAATLVQRRMPLLATLCACLTLLDLASPSPWQVTTEQRSNGRGRGMRSLSTAPAVKFDFEHGLDRTHTTHTRIQQQTAVIQLLGAAEVGRL